MQLKGLSRPGFNKKDIKNTPRFPTFTFGYVISLKRNKVDVNVHYFTTPILTLFKNHEATEISCMFSYIALSL